MSSVPPSPPDLEHDGRLKTVYRYYHRNTKELLYVGQTVRIAARGKEHRDTKQWWEAVGLVVYEHLAVGSTAADLDNAERRAIGRGWPLHNQQHNPVHHAWVADQYPAMIDHEHWFSYDLVELFARYKPSSQGPVPISRQEYRRGLRGEVDRYPRIPELRDLDVAYQRGADGGLVDRLKVAAWSAGVGVAVGAVGVAIL